MLRSLVGSEMCIRDRGSTESSFGSRRLGFVFGLFGSSGYHTSGDSVRVRSKGAKTGSQGGFLLLRCRSVMMAYREDCRFPQQGVKGCLDGLDHRIIAREDTGVGGSQAEHHDLGRDEVLVGADGWFHLVTEEFAHSFLQLHRVG